MGGSDAAFPTLKVIKRVDECFEGANPMSGLAHENLADVYLELEEPKKARKELEKARDIYREIGYDESADNISEQLESLL